jgi:glycosyltransferase involved in cell wall biosynthesis
MGGAPKFISELANWASAFADVHIVYRWGTDNFWQPRTNATFHQVDKPEEALQLIVGLKPDLVHHHFPAGNFIIPELQERKIPLIGTAHGWHYGCNEETQIVGEWVHPVSGPNPAVIRLGIDLDSFGLKQHTNKKEIVVGLVGRRGKEKIPASFLDRLEHGGLPTGVTLRVIGDGWKHQKRDEITARLEKIPGVELVGDLSPEQMPEAYQGLDVLLVPSSTEAVSYAAIEAMASGLPVVAREVDGLPHTLGNSGLLCGEDYQLIASLEKLRDNPQLRRELGEKGRNRVEKYYKLDRMLSEYALAYNETTAVVRQPDPTLDCSVVIPAYNTPVAWLKESLDSVLSQQGVNFEVVLVDDGSVDPQTIAALDSYGKLPNVRLIRSGRNEGVGLALNRGLIAARSNVIARHDSDDVMLPGALKRRIEYLKTHPDVDLVSGQMDQINEDGSPADPYRVSYDPSLPMWAQHNNQNPVLHSSATYYRQAVIEAGWYTDDNQCQDFDLWCRLQTMGATIVVLDETLFKYRMSDWTEKTKTRIIRDREIRARYTALTAQQAVEPEVIEEATEGEVMALYDTWDYTPCYHDPIVCPVVNDTTGLTTRTLKVTQYAEWEWDDCPSPSMNDGSFSYLNAIHFCSTPDPESCSFGRSMAGSNTYSRIAWLRFQLPAELTSGVIIKKAVLRFYPKNTTTKVMSCVVFGGDFAMPDTINQTDLCCPPKRTSNVAWELHGWSPARVEETPNISTVVQQYIDGDFAGDAYRGNNIILYVFPCSGENEIYEANDVLDNPAYATELQIWYTQDYSVEDTASIVLDGSELASLTYAPTTSGGVKCSGIAENQIGGYYEGFGGISFQGEASREITLTRDGSGQLTFSGAADHSFALTYTGSGQLTFINTHTPPDFVRYVAIADTPVFHNGFRYRRLVNCPTSTQPVLVSVTLDPTHVVTGSDFTFEALDESALTWQFDSYDSLTGALTAWVSPAGQSVVALYYGKDVAAIADSIPWDVNTVSVYHLSELGNGTAGEYKDCKGTNHGQGGTGVSYAIPKQSAGRIGKGQTFEGNDWIRFGNDGISTTSSITVSAWVNPNQLAIPGVFYSRGRTDTSNNQSWNYSIGHDYQGRVWLAVRCVEGGTWVTHELTSTTKLTAGTWAHVAGVWESGVGLRIFVNGRLDKSASVTATTLCNSVSSYLGLRDSSYPFNGSLDEVRISNVARSEAWIADEYVNTSATVEHEEYALNFTTSAEPWASYVTEGNGTISFSGESIRQAKYNGTGEGGNVTFSGTAPNRPTYKPRGTGGVAFSGAAPNFPVLKYQATGKVSFAGTADNSPTYQPICNGTISFTGTIGRYAASLSYNGGGNLSFGGSAPRKTKYLPSADGSVSFGGESLRLWSKRYTGSGTVNLTGESENQASYFPIVGGTLILGGSAPNQPSYWPISGGTISFDGTAPNKIKLLFAGVGGMDFVGTADNQPSYRPIVGGELLIGGTADNRPSYWPIASGSLTLTGEGEGELFILGELCGEIQVLPVFTATLKQVSCQ